MSAGRIAIGAVAGVRGGPATYAIELVRALDAGPEGDLANGFVLTDRPDLFAGLRRIEPVRLPLGSSWGQPWWDNVGVPRALRRLRPDVYHGTKHALPLLGTPAGCARVVTIHDLAVFAQPETFSLPQRVQLRLHLAHAARSADLVVCDSEHAAGDVRSRLGVEFGRLRVVPLGVSDRFRRPTSEGARDAARRRLGLPAGLLVAFVGTIQPRKRIDLAIAAVERLRADSGLEVALAIAGRRRPGFDPPWLHAPPPWIRLLGELPDEDVVALYGAADVMLSPSTYEGFGLTFAEAMACGCPVVGLRRTSVPEVVGDGGVLVERPDPAELASALREILGDPRRRADLAERALRSAARLTWARAAAQTLQVYREAARRRGPGAAPAGTPGGTGDARGQTISR